MNIQNKRTYILDFLPMSKNVGMYKNMKLDKSWDHSATTSEIEVAKLFEEMMKNDEEFAKLVQIWKEL